MMALTFASSSLSWIPAWSWSGFAVLLAVCAAVWVGLRVVWGASSVRGRLGLLLLRCVAMTMLIAILLGPTIVDEQPGERSRPALLYVVDGSQSMQLGRKSSRWQQSLKFIADAENMAGSSLSENSQTFKFGHQLEPFERKTQLDSAAATPSLLTTAVADETDLQPSQPGASDSRLADALRQLLPQVNSERTSGVVLLSDGRVRASDTVERLAEVFGKAKIPLHVVPVGEATGTGDVAVVSLVVSPKVRKHTDNEVQVFLRSFGYAGQRTSVHVNTRSRVTNAKTESVAGLPITLTGGAQSVSLKFRIDDTAEDIVVCVDPIEGELTERNNRVEAHVDINRTKVRVLYLQGQPKRGGPPATRLNQQEKKPASSGNIRLNVRTALQQDPDIECSLLRSVSNAKPRNVGANGQMTGNSGFPSSRAELFAYDCVVFSNVGPDVLEKRQVQWLTQWVEGRGGGLIVTGSEALNWQAWKDSPLEILLPVSLKQGIGATKSHSVSVTAPGHPVWRLRQEAKPNKQLVDQLPNLKVAVLGMTPKSTAEVLVTTKDSGHTIMAAHRAGRGRVFVSSADLSSPALVGDWGPRSERVAAKFWRNMVYWSTEGSSTGRRRLVARSDKRFYRPGEPLKVSATAYDEGARRTQKYRLWAMFEPASLDDMSLYSPILWPDGVLRESGEVGPRIAWGEELQLSGDVDSLAYKMDLMLSETESVGDSGFRIELTAYEGEDASNGYGHGTQVDSTSLGIQVLNDPFEQQNPLPNTELMHRIASVSGGTVLESPDELAKLLQDRQVTTGAPHRKMTLAWSRWWLWLCLIGCLTSEWIWRRLTGLA